jgi:hypothetical protein
MTMRRIDLVTQKKKGRIDPSHKNTVEQSQKQIFQLCGCDNSQKFLRADAGLHESHVRLKGDLR